MGDLEIDQELTSKEKHIRAKISEIDVAVDCDCLDKETRRVLMYIIDKEAKFLKGFPRVWVENQRYDLEVLREKIDKCILERNVKGNGGGKGKERKKRDPSEYNLHIKKCVGDEKKGFKSCVDEWNLIKKKAEA